MLRMPGWPPAPAHALAFRAPRSYTGQDAVELWVPGAPPLVRRLLLALQEEGARLADRGEFTRRAFHAGRLDLVQVEAVLALTRSADAEQARAALHSLLGGARQAIDALKDELLEVRAHLEAAIDFSTEELELSDEQLLAQRLGEARDSLLALRGEARGAPSSDARPRVALRGPANAGKSALFNRLCGASALVSPLAGTTRDVLEGVWRLPSGRQVLLIDTAGDQEARSRVEALALDAARERAASADLVLWLSPMDAPTPPPPGAELVLSKVDLRGAGDALGISVLSGVGLEALAQHVDALLAERGTATPLLGSARQDGLLALAAAALSRAVALLCGQDPARAELSAIDLQEALHAVGQLTGEVTNEDVLGRIFAGFCIGK
jgi:tRNA modification GTPase